MPSGFPRPSAIFTTTSIASLFLGFFILAGGCESGPELSLPPPPSGFVGPTNRDKVLIFIHGVTASNERSWRNPSTGAYWPELIQADPDLKEYDTYLLGYYSPKFSKASTIAEIANRELQRLKDEGLLTPDKPVVIVAHSMGGLVAKEMLTQLNRPNREELERLDRVKGIIFLSSPAQGADLGEYASWISMNPQFGNMQPADLNAFLQRLEDNWQNLLRDRDMLGLTAPRSFCAYETLPTRGMMVVSRVYAASRAHDPYTWVKARIRDAMLDKDLSRYAMLTRAKATPVADNLPPPSIYKPLVLAATEPGMVGKESLDTLYRVIIPRLQQGER